MWARFEQMPTLLKFITGHSLASIFLIIISLIPSASFSINGQTVTYSEWWSSGVGIYACFLGTALTASGIMLLLKMPYARIAYLSSLFLAMVVPYLIWFQFGMAILGVVIITLASWYLYKGEPTQYFASNSAQLGRQLG